MSFLMVESGYFRDVLQSAFFHLVPNELDRDGPSVQTPRVSPKLLATLPSCSDLFTSPSFLDPMFLQFPLSPRLIIPGFPYLWSNSHRGKRNDVCCDRTNRRPPFYLLVSSLVYAFNWSAQVKSSSKQTFPGFFVVTFPDPRAYSWSRKFTYTFAKYM